MTWVVWIRVHTVLPLGGLNEQLVLDAASEGCDIAAQQHALCRRQRAIGGADHGRRALHDAAIHLRSMAGKLRRGRQLNAG